MIMWAMSDRAIPRSLRMIEGFGVNTFRLINAEGEATFVKFHWRPKLGTQSTCWDEAVKIAGADPDFHRRDLFEAIDNGDFPEWEFGVQLLSQAEADALPFDILDATKLIPEELHPIRVVGTHDAEPQPRQLLRRDRTGRLPADQHRARHRLLRGPAAAGAAVLLSGHPAVASGHGQFPPAADQSGQGLPVPEPAARRPDADAGAQGPRQL